MKRKFWNKPRFWVPTLSAIIAYNIGRGLAGEGWQVYFSFGVAIFGIFALCLWIYIGIKRI